jgi:hypothetical protein
MREQRERRKTRDFGFFAKDCHMQIRCSSGAQATASVVVVLLAQVGHAQTKTWIGGSGNNWATAANWQPAGAPSSTDDVLIPSSAGTVIVNSVRPDGTPWSVGRMTLAANLQIDAARNFDVFGTGITMQNGTLRISQCCSGEQGVYFRGAQQAAIDGTGVIFTAPRDNNGYAALVRLDGPLTIASGITFRTDGTFALLRAQAPGSMTINGTVHALNQSIDLVGAITNIDPVNGLTGGTWYADGNTISFTGAIPNSQPIQTIGAGTTLRIKSGNFEAGTGNLNFSQLATNRGTLIAENGRDWSFAPASGVFQNFGTFVLNPGSIATFTSGSASPADFRNRSTGTLDLSVSGPNADTQQSRVVVQGGLARIDGSVTVRFAGGFEPECGPESLRTFDLVRSASKTGAFASSQVLWPSGSGGAIDYSAGTAVRLVTTQTPFGDCPSGSVPCDDIDYNNDGLFPSDDDLVAFLRVLAGGSCGN